MKKQSAKSQGFAEKVTAGVRNRPFLCSLALGMIIGAAISSAPSGETAQQAKLLPEPTPRPQVAYPESKAAAVHRKTGIERKLEQTPAPAEEHQEEWQAAFVEFLKAHSKDGNVVLAMTNFGDTQTLMPDNLVHSFGLTDPPVTEYVVVATDRQAYDYLKCRGFTAYYDWRIMGRNVTASASGFSPVIGSSAQVAFKSITFAKLDLMQAALSSGLNILLTDTDVVFVRNPIQKLVQGAEKWDAQFLWDGKHGRRGGKGDGDVQSNSGFYFMKNNQRSRDWFNYVMKSRHHKRFKLKASDQDIVLAALDPPQAGLKFDLLPRNAYLNGFVVKKEVPAKCHTPEVQKRWMAVHMNYNRGHSRKIGHFKRCGLWRCDDCKAGHKTPQNCVHDSIATQAK